MGARLQVDPKEHSLFKYLYYINKPTLPRNQSKIYKNTKERLTRKYRQLKFINKKNNTLNTVEHTWKADKYGK